jgi:hypothetical protein
VDDKPLFAGAKGAAEEARAAVKSLLRMNSATATPNALTIAKTRKVSVIPWVKATWIRS